MTLKESIKRLSYTISKQNKPNSTDADALNKIMDFVNKTSIESVQENLLFAKMFAFVLKEFLVHYKNIDIASKKINSDILSLPINYHLEVLKDNLQTIDLDLFFKEKGCKDAIFGLGIPFKEIKENHFHNKEILKDVNINEFLEVYDAWDEDTVKSNFELNINVAINQYKNV